MNGLAAPTSRVALFTNTAPSFGKVHRASYSVKDAYKVRNMHPVQREKNRLTVMKRKGKCPCGRYHDYEHELIGVPLNPFSYNYAGEIMWSENLPALQKSLVRTVRRLAESYGVPRESLSLYTVYERQKRGSLHAHTLLVVDGDETGFNALVSEIQQNWGTLHIPTAEIPSHKVTYYRSKQAKERWTRYASTLQRSEKFNPRLVILKVRWKKGQAKPGTKFGDVWDIRILHEEQQQEGELSGHKQAAAYLSKYLTKNQQATSLAAIGELGMHQKRHFEALRQTTLALTGDRVIHEAMHSNAVNELEELRTDLEAWSLVPDGVVVDDEYYEAMEALERRAIEVFQEIEALKDAIQTGETSALLPYLFNESVAVPLNVDQKSVNEFHSLAGSGRRFQRSARGLSIRLNKTLDNAGFSGALTSISNWGTTLTALKEEMKAFATADAPPVVEEYLWQMDSKRMKELAQQRAPIKSLPVIEKLDTDSILRSVFGDKFRYIRKESEYNPERYARPL
ncbi:hypothetical protein GCM10009611_07730 [Arthrobacter roseus]